VSDFVVDGLGMTHSRANFDALRRRLSPVWQRVLGPGRACACITAGILIVSDPAVPSNSFELRSGTQRVRVINVWLGDEWVELDRWADDGGRAP